jgi:hypothetical protein
MHKDRSMHLADLKSRLEADRRPVEPYTDPDGRARKPVLKVVGVATKG